MAVYTLAEMAKLSTNAVFQGIADSIVVTNELASRMPIELIAGDQLTYVRKAVPPTTAFINDAGDNLQNPSVGTFDRISVPCKPMSSDADVVAFADVIGGGRPMSTQVALKAEASWELIKQTMIVGRNTTSHVLDPATADPFGAIDDIEYSSWLDSGRFGPGEISYTDTGTFWAFRAPGDSQFGDAVACAADGTYLLRSFNRSKWIKVTLDVSDATADGRTSITFASSTYEFDGCNQVCAPSMLIESDGANGDAFSLAKLDELISMVKVRRNRVFFMNSRAILKYLNIMRAMGGATPVMTQTPGISGETMVYRGIPILENDNVALTESKGSATNLTSIYLASLDANEGLYLAAAGNGTEFVIDSDPQDVPVGGFWIESIGALEAKAQRRTRVSWAGALALRSELALARATEIAT